jgi:hypothetical protein
MRLPRPALAGALVCALAAPAGAVIWKGEIMDVEAGHAFVGFRLLDTAIYEPVTGLGIGTNPFEIKRFGWDLRRANRGPDVSGHNLVTVAPVNLYWIIHDWEGSPALFSDHAGSLTVGRLEAFGSYSNWSSLQDLTEVVGVSYDGTNKRGPVQGSVPAKYLNYGVRWDYGKWVGVNLGRLELRTRRNGVYLERYSAQWYLSGQVYFGATFGTKDDAVGGGMLYLVRSGWTRFANLFRCRSWRCTVTEDP